MIAYHELDERTISSYQGITKKLFVCADVCDHNSDTHVFRLKISVEIVNEQNR